MSALCVYSMYFVIVVVVVVKSPYSTWSPVEVVGCIVSITPFGSTVQPANFPGFCVSQRGMERGAAAASGEIRSICLFPETLTCDVT